MKIAPSLIVLLASCAVANAQVASSRSNLAGQVTSGIIDNQDGLVSPKIVRNTLLNILASVPTFSDNTPASQADPNTFTGSNTFTGPVTVNGALTATGATNLLQHAATNAALQAIVPTAAGQVYVRDGFYAAGDGGQATYTGSLSNCTTPDNGAQVQPSGTGCWQQSTNFDVKVFGAYGDGVHNDTAAIQNDINAAEALLSTNEYWGPYNIPAVRCSRGRYFISGIALQRASFLGDGQQSCFLALLAGANTSVITVNAPPLSDPPQWNGLAQIELAGFSIDGNASAQTGTSQGVYLPQAPTGMPYGPGARIHDITMNGIKNNGIYVSGNRNLGWIDRVHINYANNDCVYLAGSYDWFMAEDSFGACAYNGVELYFASAVTISDSAIYNNGSDGVKVDAGFGSYLWITGSTIGANGGNGLDINPGSLITDGVIGLSNVHLTDNSSSTNNSSSQIFVADFPNLSLDNVWFYYAGSGYNAKYLINNDSSGYVNVSNLHYSTAAGSAPYVTAAFATPSNIMGAVNPDSGTFGLNVPFSATKGTLSSSNQYDGLYFNNGTNTTAKLFGTSGTNDNAYFQLFNNNTQGVNIAASGSSYFNGGSVGFGNVSPSYQADVTGQVRATAGFVSGSTAGVSCSGTPTSSFASVNGIVTHC